MGIAEKNSPLDPRKKRLGMEERVARRFGHFGNEISGLVLYLATQPPIIRRFMKKYAIDPQKSLDRQFDELEAVIIERGSAGFLMRVRYEISRALHHAEIADPQLRRAGDARGLAIIKTANYEGPDRRRSSRDRRLAEERRGSDEGLRLDKRSRGERRAKPRGRRKTDTQD